MALNAGLLASSIMTELNINPSTQPDAAAAWTKIAEKIVEHIKTNAEVNVVGVSSGSSAATGEIL